MTPRKAPDFFELFDDIFPALENLGWSKQKTHEFGDAFMAAYEVSNDSYQTLGTAEDLRDDAKYSKLYTTLAEGREALDAANHGIDPSESISIYVSW